MVCHMSVTKVKFHVISCNSGMSCQHASAHAIPGNRLTVCLTARVLGRVLSVEPERFEVKLTTASDKLADRDSEWEELYCSREVLDPR